MADLDLLTEIHSDVRYIKETLTNHIAHDDKVNSEFIRPLWESHQQNKGAAKFAIASITGISGFIGGLVEYLSRGSH